MPQGKLKPQLPEPQRKLNPQPPEVCTEASELPLFLGASSERVFLCYIGVILWLYWGYIGVILGQCKKNGNYCIILGL